MGATDQDLLAAYKAGNLEAFRMLYERHARPLLAYALGMLHDRDHAEELLQNVFIAFVKRAAALPADTSVKAYLFASARNRMANMLRDKQRADRRVNGYEVFARVHGAESQEAGARLDAEETRRRLNRALARLPDEEREVVLLRAQGELSFTQMAAELALPRGTVTSRYRAAISKLREFLSHE